METMIQSVKQISVPPEARSHRTLTRTGYEDAFVAEVPTAGDRTAEDWMRLVLEDAPLSARKTLRSGWFWLGLKLGPADSRSHVLGWEIRRRTPDLVLLGAASRIGMPAELLLERRPSSLLFCTFVRHENPVVRVAWTAIVAKPHQQVVPRLLRMAVQPSGSTIPHGEAEAAVP